jgi:hypothetical protein
MSCKNCAELCVRFSARTPGELRKAVSIVAANLADGTLKETAPDPSSGFNTGPFAPVAAGTEWPDTFSFWFECSQCAERFSLQADTYHSSGGSWQPARSEAVREAL